MELWIAATLSAALFQTVRFMLQKTLSSGALSAGGATMARFIYAAPVLILALFIYQRLSGAVFWPLPMKFWSYALLGGIGQILATALVLLLFRQRNFAVGVALKKTEILQTAFVSLILLGEGISLGGMLALGLGFIAILLLSGTKANNPTNPGQSPPGKVIFMGLLCGLLFAVSAVAYRGATLLVPSELPLLRAAVTLAVVTSMQSALLALWLWLRERGEVTRLLRHWRRTALVGLTSMGGSLSWFVAFTMQNASYVKALGQVEVFFSLLASWLFFRESITLRELAGIALMGLSITILIIFAQ